MLVLLAVLLAVLVVVPNWAAARRGRRVHETFRSVDRVRHAMEAIRARDRSPLPPSLAELERLHGSPLVRVDGWGNPLTLSVDGSHYAVRSCGEAGICGDSADDDLVVADGRFIKTPGNMVICY